MIVSIFIISLFVTALTPLAASGEVWVDPSGTDAPDNGGVSAPYKTIQYALAQVGENAIVHVNPGTYYELITIPEGTSVIGAERDSVIIDGSGLGLNSVSLSAASSSIVNCTIRHTGGYGVYLVPSPSSVNGGMVINCLIENVYGGIVMEYSSGQYYVNIIDTVVTNTEHDGIRLLIQEDTTFTALIDNCIIENNNSSNDGIDIDIEGYADITISNSIIRNNGDDGLSCDFEGGESSGGSGTLRLDSNMCYSNEEDGFELEIDSQNANGTFVVVNNIIRDNQDGLSLESVPEPLGATYIVSNNTIAYNRYDGIYAYGDASFTFCNNILYNNGSFIVSANGKLGPSSDYYGIDFGSDQGTFYLSHNCYFGNYDGPYGMLPADITLTGELYTNPLFVDPWGDNYLLGTQSPCIDAGIPTSSPAFGSVYSDIRGVSRPQGHAYDIGCYELVQSSWSPISTKPLLTHNLAKASQMWTCVQDAIEGIDELGQEAEELLESIQSHMAHAETISNPVHASGELRKAIDLMEQLNELLECGCTA